MDLTRGVPMPGGGIIRMAGPGDLDAVRQLMEMAEPGISDDAQLIIEHPRHGAGILRALRDGLGPDDVHLRLAPRMSAYDVLMDVSLVLVAVDAHGAVIGALMALPPVRMLWQSRESGVPLIQILHAGQTVVKIKGVGVDPTVRGSGVGSALIDLCVRMYFSLGWKVVYGQVDRKSKPLVDYYTRRGFEVLGRFRPIELAAVLAFPLTIYPLAGERLFVRWATAEPGSGLP